MLLGPLGCWVLHGHAAAHGSSTRDDQRARPVAANTRLAAQSKSFKFPKRAWQIASGAFFAVAASGLPVTAGAASVLA